MSGCRDLHVKAKQPKPARKSNSGQEETIREHAPFSHAAAYTMGDSSPAWLRPEYWPVERSGKTTPVGGELVEASADVSVVNCGLPDDCELCVAQLARSVKHVDGHQRL